MSAAAPALPSERDQGHQPDNIASGVSTLLVVNVVQRGIGFVRNLALCYFLTDQQLGLWGLASSFFFLAAPLAVLGLPGTFGRFVETYRARGQLRPFLSTLLSLSFFGFLVLATILVVWPASMGTVIFGEPLHALDMLGVAIALGCIILFNSATELLAGLRLPNTVSTMHAVNSFAFTITSLAAVAWIHDWRMLVISFAVSALLGVAPALPVLARLGLWESQLSDVFSWKDLMRRIGPYAVSIWVINLVLNLFDVVDRYSLLHFAAQAGQSELGQSQVGQLHSGKLIPTLLANLAVMLGGMVLPYLAAEWEAGKTSRVVALFRTSIKLGAMFFFGLTIGALLTAPFLFDWLLRGRYADGMEILPAALLICCWLSLANFFNNYFWCAEKGRMLGILASAALVTNIVLNLLLVPRWGLHGAMTANVMSMGLLLALYGVSLSRLGVSFGWGTWLIVVAPVSLLAGPIPAAFVWGALIVLASRTDWLLSDEEKTSIDASLMPVLKKFGVRATSLWAR